MCGDAGGDSGSDYGGAYSDHTKQREAKLAAMSVSEREAFLAKEAKLHKEMSHAAFGAMGMMALIVAGFHLYDKFNPPAPQAIEYKIDRASLGKCITDVYRDNVINNDFKYKPLLVSQECAPMIEKAVLAGIESSGELQAKIQSIRDRASDLGENKIQIKM